MAFKLTPEQLASLFEPDNIRHGDSMEQLRKWGKIDGLEHLLHTNYRKGIYKDSHDHEARIKAYGDNQPIVKPPKTIWELIVENFEDEMLRILCAAAAVSLILGVLTEGLAEGWHEGASILIAVVIIVTVTSGNNYVKEQQFQKLNAMATAKDVHVYRGGDLIKMSVYDLLVGDVVQISTGQIFSVDGILIQGNDISVDESSLTGETNEIKKEIPKTYQNNQAHPPFLISSSKLMSGTGLMVVCGVGKHSYYGKLKMKIQQDQDETPLQIKLSDLADQVGRVGMFSAAATFSAMFIHYIYDCFADGSFVENFVAVGTIHEVIEYFIIAVSIVVVAVPEGLPLSVTIALAYSVGKMKDENNLVRYLQACETMGGADNICSDKTGTLTKNLMEVTKIFIQENTHEIIARQSMSDNTCRVLCLSVCNNSNANPKFVAEKNQPLRVEQNGNKTQCALIEMAYNMGFDYEKFRNRDKIKKIFPFSSERKKMTTIYEDEKGKLLVFVKGAPDFMIPHCSHYINKDGGVSKINQEFIQELNGAIDDFASSSLRTILLTYREIKSVTDDRDSVENNLTVLGLIGIKDPLREGILDAVRMCHEGGVRVRMVTGDNKQTAIAIAKEAGILSPDWVDGIENDYTVMEGKEFRTFVGGLVNQGTEDEPDETVGNMENFKLIRDQLCVLARSSPEDKYLITTGLKKLDHVVAMTGDGTNDAPALKKADIGFAMGIAGTEVAKEASGIILLDDNFVSIVTAMKWGRNIFDSIRKFLQFQLTVNFVALVMAFVGGAVLRESPLNPIQMLWVNLIMDTLASLALATEPPHDDLLKRMPYHKREHLITPLMWKFILTQGTIQIFILGVILFKGPEIFGIPSSIGVKDWNEETGKHYSIFFNVFVLMQVFNEINARKLKANEYNVFQDFFNNKLFLIIVVSTIIIQLTMVKYGGESLKTVELSFKENLLCLVIGSFSLFSALLCKIVLPQHMIITLYGIELGTFKFYWRKVPEEVKED